MIIIIGDSWGVGEWDKECNLNGPGFGQYLMLHEQVINLCVGSASNTQSIQRLSRILGKLQIDEHDTIYWIVTCPSRCINIYDHLKNQKSLQQIFHENLFASFESAQKIAQTYSTQINLIGGLCDLESLDITFFDRLCVKVPSWCSLLCDNYPSSFISPSDWYAVGKIIKKYHQHHLTEWNDIADIITSKGRMWNMLFTTDGAHPDRFGHKILHNYLYPEWAWKIE
jgi:hypothetical protein